MSNPYSQHKHCKCGKLITNNSKSCSPCFNFTLKKPIKKHYCMDCEKEIKRWDAIRCKSCAQKGERNSAFTNGDTIKIHYCKCGNEKDYRAKTCAECYYRFNKGKNHGSWKGGIATLPYPYEFHQIKDEIRKRDNYTCQQCEIKEKNYRRNLDVHHIDYDKKNNKKSNLITLCQSCNTLVNFNRDYWYAYFTYLMERE